MKSIAFAPNSTLTMFKSSLYHDETKSLIALAKTTRILHLNHLNLDYILNEVFTIKNLIRLDLSYNSIKTIQPEIGKLSKLQVLWLNNNPLIEIPLEIAECKNLREIDLHDTSIVTLPREMASLKYLTNLNLENCPLKESLESNYKDGIATMHKTLRQKDDRKLYKQKLLSKLSEYVYPSINKASLTEITENIFFTLKGCPSNMLKKLCRDAHIIFPLKFQDIDCEKIKKKLYSVFEETHEREEASKIQLKLRSHFKKEDLKSIVNLSKDILKNGKSEFVDTLLKFKKNTFLGNFQDLTSETLCKNYENFVNAQKEQYSNAVNSLKKKIKRMYLEEKLDEEIINKYANEIAIKLKRTKHIEEFCKNYKQFLPKPQELKTFNSQKIVESFFYKIKSTLI